MFCVAGKGIAAYHSSCLEVCAWEAHEASVQLMPPPPSFPSAYTLDPRPFTTHPHAFISRDSRWNYLASNFKTKLCPNIIAFPRFKTQNKPSVCLHYMSFFIGAQLMKLFDLPKITSQRLKAKTSPVTRSEGQLCQPLYQMFFQPDD